MTKIRSDDDSNVDDRRGAKRLTPGWGVSDPYYVPPARNMQEQSQRMARNIVRVRNSVASKYGKGDKDMGALASLPKKPRSLVTRGAS